MIQTWKSDKKRGCRVPTGYVDTTPGSTRTVYLMSKYEMVDNPVSRHLIHGPAKVTFRFDADGDETVTVTALPADARPCPGCGARPTPDEHGWCEACYLDGTQESHAVRDWLSGRLYYNPRS